jgi:hypothetical protein
LVDTQDEGLALEEVVPGFVELEVVPGFVELEVAVPA